jgi:phosphatidylglycerophosphatase A
MIRRLMMTGFGLGYAPVASGTFGSAGAIVVAGLAWWGLSALGAGTAWQGVAWVMLTLLAGAGCVCWGPWAVEYFAGRSRKTGDPGQVVLDEFAGQWVALIGLPMATPVRAAAVLSVQFLLFRVFDIIKPPPGRRLEKLPAGWGILTDDIAAGLYANVLGQILFRLIWPA